MYKYCSLALLGLSQGAVTPGPAVNTEWPKYETVITI